MFNKVSYYTTLVFIFIISLIYYAPFNDYLYNSDHAIHVLMAKDFQFPRDLFYWGQNRLGSFFPFITFLLEKVLNIHLLYVSTITLYLFLLTSFVILAKAITSSLMKIALFTLIFLPLGEYHYLILIGHPYSTQLLSGVLFIYFLYLLKKHILSDQVIGKTTILYSLSLITLSFLFYFISIWTSELSLVFILIPFLSFLFDKSIFKLLKTNFKNGWLYLLLTYSFSLFGLCVLGLKKLKSYTEEDTVYDSPFLTDTAYVKTHFQYFLNKLEAALLFQDNALVENIFYWFLIILVSFLIVRFIKQPKIILAKNQLANLLFLLSLVVTIALFLSRWNFRSEFAPRYFTPIYIPFCYALILAFDQFSFVKKLKPIVALIFILLPISYCFSNYVGKKTGTAFEQYGEYRLLPQGVLFGGYWDAYKISSIAIDNLQPLPYDHEFVRNKNWKENLLRQDNFYILNNNGYPGGLKDIVFQFGLFFKFSGTKYNCNGAEVLEYHKLYNSIDPSYKIKAANNKYLSVDPSTLLVTASEVNYNKAESFQITQAWGKWLIKRKSGYYFALDEVSKNIYANHEGSWGAALMSLKWNKNYKMEITASNEKGISLNLEAGNKLSAANSEAFMLREFPFEK